MVAVLALPMSAYAAVKINKKTATIQVGKTVSLKISGAKKGTKISWASNKKAVATVSSKGVVKGVKAGTAKITAKVGKKKYSCTVTVKEKASNSHTTTLKSVNIDPYYLEDDVMHIGDTLTLVARSQDEVVWKSTNPAVATVNNVGLVTALKKGKTNIVAVSKKDSTLFDAAYIKVEDGQELKRENYSKYLNFEFKTVPVLVFYRGMYQYDGGKLVLGDWQQEQVEDPVTHYHYWKYVNKGDIHKLTRFEVDYYISLDEASLNKNYDFDQTVFSVNGTYLVAPTNTVITANTTAWNNPSFAVTGTKIQRFGESSDNFEFTEFKNGELTDLYGDPLFNVHAGTRVYEYVYPEEFVQKPIYGRCLTSSSGDEYNSIPTADSNVREYFMKNLVDMNSFGITNVTGTLYNK
jgi:hypothetical protein